MKKIIIIFLSVICLVAGGCSKSDKSSDNKEVALGTETPTEAPTEKAEDTEQVTETPTEESTENTTEDAKGEESNGSEEVNQDKQQQNKTSDDDSVEEQKQESSYTESQQTNETQAEQPVQPAPEQTQPTQTQQPARVEYSPQNVVELATAKTKAAGKVLLTENLDNLLAAGSITQEEYKEYYPYDGAGYYSVFVDSNMAEARDVSGTEHFNSEDDIAQYIADMLALENGPYFLIEYAGTYDYYGKVCYEFRCYRA